MNFYRDFMRQPYDAFRQYQYNPESEADKEVLLMMGQTVRKLTKQCHKQCFKINQNYSSSCIKNCGQDYLRELQISLKRNNSELI